MRIADEAHDDAVVVCQLPQVVTVDVPEHTLIDETSRINSTYGNQAPDYGTNGDRRCVWTTYGD